MALQTKLADKLADFRHFRSVRYNKCGKGVKDGSITAMSAWASPPRRAHRQALIGRRHPVISKSRRLSVPATKYRPYINVRDRLVALPVRINLVLGMRLAGASLRRDRAQSELAH
jgi:hypothetical protein